MELETMKAHSDCEDVFYCDRCETAYSIEEGGGVWDSVRQDIAGECPKCEAIMFSDWHEEECEKG